MAPTPPTLREFLRARTRMVGLAAVAGTAVGGVALVAYLAFGDATFASRKAFAVGALVFGVGLLGWSGSIMAGTGFETMQEHLDVRTGWTEEGSRRAMARLVGFGCGWMLGVSVASALVGG